jgi:hypothetical protein
MNKTIVINKMSAEPGTPVRYYLDGFNMNFFLNRRISVKFNGFQCLNCKGYKPVFRQGVCKSCFFELPQTADWVMRPELSKAHLNIEDRDIVFERKIQLQPHIVYLVNSSNVSVGVVQKKQLITRCVDMGADEVIQILKVPNRYLAGLAQVAIKEHMSDKTNWRKMLQGNSSKNINLHNYYDLCKNIIESNLELNELLSPYFIEKNEALTKSLFFDYPINQSRIKKVKILNMPKKKNYNGMLTGIRGQYLVFNNSDVLNVRSNEGLILNIKTI